MSIRTVTYILSSDFSGSTWLALLLGSHSRALYVGEIFRMFLPHPVPCRLCEERSRTCPLFYNVNEINIRDIHETILNRSGKSVLIDNSKRISWSKRFIGEERFSQKYIHLIRDPRAIAYSMKMRKQSMDPLAWTTMNYQIRSFLIANRLDHRMITYNELAQDTDEVLTFLCNWLGLEFEPGQKEYWNQEHHGPGQNGATAAFLKTFITPDHDFYIQMKRKQFHDLRWKEALDHSTQESILNNSDVSQLLGDLGLGISDDGLTRVTP